MSASVKPHLFHVVLPLVVYGERRQEAREQLELLLTGLHPWDEFNLRVGGSGVRLSPAPGVELRAPAVPIVVADKLWRRLLSRVGVR